ncbi:MAG TPA: hypothetical protein PLH92_04555 [Mycobacterium sp.]|uniref:hypothetical protein n=1 Tax=Mycolicibacterium sp. TaxID=2320850 RepID=UPI0025F7D395|nr:hypothetical protein [Mycolicibacterium sp.]HPX35598.1 hypothetical protein [Mycobacterium sp.]HQC75976.1 hypothetical protein [Mycobacterium sp.]
MTVRAGAAGVALRSLAAFRVGGVDGRSCRRSAEAGATVSRADRVVVARAVRFVLLGFGADDAVVAEAVSPTSAVATATGPTIMKDPKSIAAPAHAQRCSIALPT